MLWIKRAFIAALLALVAGALVFAFLPQPVRVDVEQVRSGPMQVTVRDDGMTRIRDRYVVSTPISGRLQRISWEVGDEVHAGKSVIARMEPTAPELLDPRAQAMAEARVSAAQGRLRRAETEAEQARANLSQAEVDAERFRTLARQNATTPAQVEAAELVYRTRSEALKGAEFAAEIAQFELQQEQAALMHVAGETGEPRTEFEIKSPINGRVLRKMQESSAVLAAGAPLLELGDPRELEVVVDVLSTDAVRIASGQPVRFEQWGGEVPLEGIVRLVEPAGFTKISALGVEEQRVNVIIDFLGQQDVRRPLGDGYRVEAAIVVWESDETLTVSTGTLFRVGEKWAVFVLEDGKAKTREIEVGQTNGLRAQVLAGLKAGETVILHPSDQVSDGVELEVREE